MTTGSFGGDSLNDSNNENSFGLFGDDTLTAVAGSEDGALLGGQGNDLYVFNSGSNPIILENGFSNDDTVRVPSSFGGDDTQYYNIGGRHLFVQSPSTGESALIVDWQGAGNRIEHWIVGATNYSYDQFHQLVVSDANYHDNADAQAVLGISFAQFQVEYQALLDNQNSLEAQAIDQRFGTEDGTIFRFYNQSNGRHFYTASSAERDSVVKKYDQFVFEGPVYKAAAGGGDLENVYRFYNSHTGAHFYTASEQERDFVQNTYHDFAYEGEVYKAHATASSGAEALHRFYNTATGTHFYTVNEAEKASVMANLPSYHYEGVAYYVDHLA